MEGGRGLFWGVQLVLADGDACAKTGAAKFRFYWYEATSVSPEVGGGGARVEVAMRGLAASSARHESLVQPKPLRALLAPVVALPRQPAVGCAALGALAALAEPGDVREALLSSLLPAVGRAGLLEAIEKHAPPLADAHLPAATLLAVLASVCLTSLAPAAGSVRGRGR